MPWCLHTLEQERLDMVVQRMAPNNFETNVEGLDSMVSFCRLPMCLTEDSGLRGDLSHYCKNRSVGIQSPLKVFNFGEKTEQKTSVGSVQLRAVIGSLHNVFVFH